MSIVVLIVAAIVCIVAVLRMGKLWTVVKSWKLLDEGVEGVPGPRGWPLLGNLLDLWVPVEDIVLALLKLLHDYQKEPVVKAKIFHMVYYGILKGSAAEVILKEPQQVNKSDLYDLAKVYLRTGLLTSRRELWEKRRKMINHSFHVSILEGFLPVFNEKAQILVGKLEKLAGTGPFDVDPLATLCSLDIICETTMGYALNSQENSDDEFLKSLKGLVNGFQTRGFRPWLHSDFLYSFTKKSIMEKKSLAYVVKFTKHVIKHRRELLQREKEIQEKPVEQDDGFVRKRRLALLDLLLEGKIDGKNLTDEEVLDEVNISMHAGHETTASAITSVLFLLGLHQDVQKRVREEILSVLGDEDGPATGADLAKLKYFEAAIKESLRLYPSVAFIGRELSADAIIGGHKIPSGSQVYLLSYLIHRDPEVFSDPEKFCPDRFYGETALKLTPYQYLPFSAGPRNCVGHRFAMLELKVVLGSILRRFNVVSHQKQEDMKFLVAPVLESVHGKIISLQKISAMKN